MARTILPIPGQELKDRYVALLAYLPRRILRRSFEPGAELVQLAMRLLDLLIDQSEASRNGADMGTGGLRGAGRHPQGRLAQDPQHLGGIDAA
ncbi:MAG TPA: hypothetical protein VGI22_13565, partial [Xanthobacteraceae bacterium]